MLQSRSSGRRDKAVLRRAIRSVGLTVMFALLAVPAYGANGRSDAKAPKGKPIKIGVLASLSGPRPLIGQVEKIAAESAAADINKAGGINGRPVQIVVQDDAFDTATALLGAKSLVQSGVVAIAGMASSNFVVALAPFATENKVVLMTSVGTATGIVDGQKYAFRTAGSNDSIGPQVAKIATQRGNKKIAVIHDTSDYSVSVAAAVVDAINKQPNVRVATNQVYNPRPTDLTAQVINIVNSGADSVIALPSNGPDFAQIAKALISAGAKLPVYSHNGPLDPDAISVGASYYDQLPQLCAMSALDLTRKPVKDLYARLQKKLNADPGNESAYQTYDAIRVLGVGLANSKGRGGAALAAGLEKIKRYDGFGAKDSYYMFTPTKHTGPTGDYLRQQCWSNGRFRYVVKQ
jgi:branched-chain amino acid transport system substrate-binding protein